MPLGATSMSKPAKISEFRRFGGVEILQKLLENRDFGDFSHIFSNGLPRSCPKMRKNAVVRRFRCGIRIQRCLFVQKTSCIVKNEAKLLILWLFFEIESCKKVGQKVGCTL